MKSDVDLLARCKALSRAAMERAADVAAPAASAAAEVKQLEAFTPKARARILAVLDRLPGKVRPGGG
jgi:hypothetical protein